MTLIDSLRSQMTLPVMGAPMFIVSNPELVIAQCLAGVIGSFPALNARPQPSLSDWLTRIEAARQQAVERQPQAKIAPYAVNQIVHASNERLLADMLICEQHKVPIIVTSLGLRADVIDRVHGWGGLVFHDVINIKHARKAAAAGVDGLILVAAGAGGHAGMLSPFALVAEVRKFYQGIILLSGAISTGAQVLASIAMGADLAYVGTRFIATHEANASADYKTAIQEANAEDILYTPFFTGIYGNYLTSSVVRAGLDPAKIQHQAKADIGLGKEADSAKAWRDIWGAGQGVGSIDEVLPTTELIAQMQQQYQQAKQNLI